MQIPLTAITGQIARSVPGGQYVGNALFWIAFCFVGQPLVLTCMAYKWVLTYQPQLLDSPVSAC